MKEVGDEFKNRFKKFTGPTEKRFKKINTAELRQFVLEALGEQRRIPIYHLLCVTRSHPNPGIKDAVYFCISSRSSQGSRSSGSFGHCSDSLPTCAPLSATMYP